MAFVKVEAEGDDVPVVEHCAEVIDLVLMLERKYGARITEIAYYAKMTPNTGALSYLYFEFEHEEVTDASKSQIQAR